MVNIDQFFIFDLGTLAYPPQGCIMSANASWKEQYIETILEVSGQKMPQRITETRQAISERLHNLEHDSDHHAERQQIVDALRALAVLENESQRW
jgi:hypothetical protein